MLRRATGIAFMDDAVDLGAVAVHLNTTISRSLTWRNLLA